MGDYCEECVTKWSRCICRPESDWDDDQNYIVWAQMDNPSTKENNRHPIPSNWINQEDGKVSEKQPFSQCKYWDISDTQEAKNDSDCNDNLYPQNYRARSQPQAPSRQPPPGWPQGVRQQSILSPTSNTENHTNTNITKLSERRQPMLTERRKRPQSWPKMQDPQLLYQLMETKEKEGQSQMRMKRRKVRTMEKR